MSEANSNLEIIKFVLEIVGEDPVDIPVAGVADKIQMKIPENTKYNITLHFKVKSEAIKDFKYKQEVRRAGIPFRTREIEIGPLFEPLEEVYTKRFDEDETPGGWALRANYSCTSTYYSGEDQLRAVDWGLEIVKK